MMMFLMKSTGGDTMLTSNFKIPIPAVDLQQALTDIIESIAMEDVSLGSILAAESLAVEKLKKNSDDIQEFVCVNESVNGIVKSIAKLQIILQFGLEDAKDLLKKIDEIGESENLEE